MTISHLVISLLSLYGSHEDEGANRMKLQQPLFPDFSEAFCTLEKSPSFTCMRFLIHSPRLALSSPISQS